MQILRNDAIPAGDWSRLIDISPFSSPFQTHGFYNLARSVWEMSAEAVALTVEGQVKSLVVAVLFLGSGFKGRFSRRAIIFGGPLVEPGFRDYAGLLMEQLDIILKGKVIYAETRNLSDYGFLKDHLARFSWHYNPYYNFKLDTSDKDLLVKAVSSSRMRQIRKAERSGVTWRVAGNFQEVDRFYDILSDLYRTKVRKPLPAREFFRAFLSSGNGVFLLVVSEGQIIGGIMCPVLTSRAIYEFYVCGLDHDYKDQYPSIMATWAAIQYASMNGIPLFDFMGAGSPGSEYGVRDFKARFGGTLVEHGRFRKVYKPVLFALGRRFLQFRTLIRI